MKKFTSAILMVLLLVSVASAQSPLLIRKHIMAMENSGVTQNDLTGISLPEIKGQWYFVDPTSGSASYDGKTPARAVASIETAYGLCTSGAGDGIVVYSRSVSGSSNSVNLTTKLAWTKYGITVVGIAAPNGYFGRARISHAAAHDSMATLMLLSGQNNTFINIDFYNNPENDGAPVSATTQVSAVQVSGARNAFINCHFNCSPQSANAYKSDLHLLAGSDECLYQHCYFGSSSYDAGDNAACWIYLAGAAAQNFFEDCTFLQQVSAGTAFGGFETSGATVLNGIDIFKNCVFAVWRANTHADICASWFIGTKPNTGNIAMLDCLTVGFTKIDAVGANDVVWSNQPAAAAGGGIGVATY